MGWSFGACCACEVGAVQPEATRAKRPSEAKRLAVFMGA